MFVCTTPYNVGGSKLSVTAASVDQTSFSGLSGHMLTGGMYTHTYAKYNLSSNDPHSVESSKHDVASSPMHLCMRGREATIVRDLAPGEHISLTS